MKTCYKVNTRCLGTKISLLLLFCWLVKPPARPYHSYMRLLSSIPAAFSATTSEIIVSSIQNLQIRFLTWLHCAWRTALMPFVIYGIFNFNIVNTRNNDRPKFAAFPKLLKYNFPCLALGEGLRCIVASEIHIHICVLMIEYDSKRKLQNQLYVTS